MLAGTGASKGNVYQVLVPGADPAGNATVMDGAATVAPHATLAPGATLARDATVAPRANNKYDDDLKNNHHQRGTQHLAVLTDERNHSGAAAPRERETNQEADFERVRTAYERFTGNRWSKSDSEAYGKHRLDQLPVGRIISVLESVVRRTPLKINSFNYFVREILAVPDPRNRAWRKKQLEKIVTTIQDLSVGRAGYSSIDLLEDIKCACAREGIVFHDDLYNELVDR